MNTIIAGCVRNCAMYLKNVFENIKKIQEIDALDVKKIVLAYDESTDNTFFDLMELKKEFNVEILISKIPLTNERTQNICNARNNLLHYINNLEYDVEYLIVMDFDDVCAKPIYTNVLVDVLAERALWDCVTFNNERYYDFWALSIGDFQYSCWHWNDPQRVIRLMHKYLQERLNEASANDANYIECDSAFNGFAIYKYKRFKGCVYKSVIDDLTIFNVNKLGNMRDKHGVIPNAPSNTNAYDCEHRYYHLNAKKNNEAKIFICKNSLFPKYTGSHADFLYA